MSRAAFILALQQGVSALPTIKRVHLLVQADCAGDNPVIPVIKNRVAAWAHNIASAPVKHVDHQLLLDELLVHSAGHAPHELVDGIKVNEAFTLQTPWAPCLTILGLVFEVVPEGNRAVHCLAAGSREQPHRPVFLEANITECCGRVR